MHLFLARASLLLFVWLHLSVAIPLSSQAADLISPASPPVSLYLSTRSLSSSPLAKRVEPQWFALIPGWSAAIENFLPVAPSLFAAGAIAKLYNSILADCANLISSTAAPLVHGGVFHIGALEFAFEGNAPVPWEIIQGLVQSLYQLTSKGYINTFVMWITNNVQVFRFILRVGPGSPFGARGPP